MSKLRVEVKTESGALLMDTEVEVYDAPVLRNKRLYFVDPFDLQQAQETIVAAAKAYSAAKEITP